MKDDSIASLVEWRTRVHTVALLDTAILSLNHSGNLNRSMERRRCEIVSRDVYYWQETLVQALGRPVIRFRKVGAEWLPQRIEG